MNCKRGLVVFTFQDSTRPAILRSTFEQPPTMNAATLAVMATTAIQNSTTTTPNAVPVIPDQFYAEIHGNTTGNISGVPTGVGITKQYYDYTNRRVRRDFDDGTSKIYDYKTLVDPGNEPTPKFPMPQGFKFRTDNIANTCCWTWLIDSDTQNAETMSRFEVESNAKDVGKDAKGEHWASVSTFPFLQTDDWWFKDGQVSASNSYVNIPGVGYVMSNGTYVNVSYGAAAVPASVFEHPDSRPTFGKCKQCGVDDECPMWQCMQ